MNAQQVSSAKLKWQFTPGFILVKNHSCVSLAISASHNLAIYELMNNCILTKNFINVKHVTNLLLPSQIWKPIKLHSKQEKAFECNECPISFLRNAELTSHLRVHTGEKPFKCESCDKCFSHSFYLKTHQRIHFDREKAFKCKQCPSSFVSKPNLMNHVRIHSGEKPFKCEDCNKCFSRSSYLNNHKIIHSNEQKAFVCIVCSVHFKSKSALVKHHTRNHDGEKPC